MFYPVRVCSGTHLPRATGQVSGLPPRAAPHIPACGGTHPLRASLAEPGTRQRVPRARAARVTTQRLITETFHTNPPVWLACVGKAEAGLDRGGMLGGCRENAGRGCPASPSGSRRNEA